jgi:hypothetical protein
MLKLEEGVDMKTVCDQCIFESGHIINFSSLSTWAFTRTILEFQARSASEANDI